MPAASPDQRPLTTLRWPLALILAALAGMPFLFVAVPPLTDVPGHMGRFAVQTAPAGSSLLRYFGFHWTLTLNLASDALVQLFAPLVGVQRVVWLLSAATPVLTVCGLLAIARLRNPRGAYALPWALVFVFNFPFFWGFLNFALTAAIGLIAFATWIALEQRRRWRAALFLAVMPLLLIGHGVAGIVTLGLIVGHSVGEAPPPRTGRWARDRVRSLRPLWPPLLATAVTLAVWKAVGASDHGLTVWLPLRKLESIETMLRDQNALLDIGSVVACVVVWILGWRWKARFSGGAAGAVITLIVLFVCTPSLLSGSDRLDTRLAPLIPMLAFALQDWSAVDARRRRAIALAGFALLAVRFGVTTASFIGYDQRYTRELTALDYVRPGARILNLTQVDCGIAGWRSHRLEHLANLATLRRDAWVNAHWSIDGIQLLQIRYSASPAYDRDPSQLLWPRHCVDLRKTFAQRDRHMLIESMPALPLDRVDYLWLVDAKLPVAYRDPRLERIWTDDISELYAIRKKGARIAPDAPSSGQR